MNWMRENLAWIGLRDGLDGQRLGEAGHAFEQDVPAREQADEDALDHVLLADDDLADLVEDRVHEGALALDQVVDDTDVVVHSLAPRRRFVGRARTVPCSPPEPQHARNAWYFQAGRPLEPGLVYTRRR